VPLGIGLKQGSWRVLADKAQGIEELPRHVRLDGRQIRYLPMRGTVDRDGAAVPVRTLIFPEFRPAAGTTSRKLRPADALLRLAAARYDTQLGAYGSLVHRVARQRSEL
jgi:hypothetical protein